MNNFPIYFAFISYTANIYVNETRAGMDFAWP